MMQPDEYPDHNPGCFRQHIGFIHPEGLIGAFPSFRNRWDCPGCLSRKLWRGLGHLAGLDLRTSWERQREIRDSARRIRTGYCAISFQGQTDRFILSTPQLLPDKPPQPFLAVLKHCINLGFKISIARLSYNRIWTPEHEETGLYTFPTYNKILKEVHQTIIDAGFPDFHTDGVSAEAAAQRIKVRLNGVELDLDSP